MTKKRHPFHSICPYFAMFPEEFVEQQLLSFTSPGDTVFDPFCGRGTTVFESILKDRRAGGSDVNPVAVCVSSAKATAPAYSTIVERIDELESQFEPNLSKIEFPSPFFKLCFEENTFSEILYIKSSLKWQSDAPDCFIAAVMLGILHGESHKSEYCLSNRMPRTISTKPDYSVRWWTERNLMPPRRHLFDTLRKAIAFRYRMQPADRQGTVRLADARTASMAFPELNGQVRLIVTSPPYLDTTDYAEDQWLRLWFLGGAPHPELRKNRDDRHTRPDRYWDFLRQSWAGLDGLLAPDATIVIRIGGAKLSKEDLLNGLADGLAAALPNSRISTLHGGVTSNIVPRETSAFRPAPPRSNVEHDFVFKISSNEKMLVDAAA